MGLTIHYVLRSSASYVDDARQLVEQLRRRALDLPFKHVSNPIDLSGSACDYEQCDRDQPHRWLLIQVNQPVEREGYIYNVAPTRLIAFSTSPGEGCEQANFGLCRYPRFVKDRTGRKVPTGLPADWSWQSFCKTQYASNPATGDLENFLKAHLSIIHLLDHAKGMGILGEVSDESGYDEGRDVQALVKEVGNWNSMTAGFVGDMKDLIGAEVVQSEITKFPNYEHLEAERRANEPDNGDGT